MYVQPNFKTKKQLREAIARGDKVTAFQPGPFEGATMGDVSVEGPHYPEPHRWYARVRIVDSVVTAVLQ